MRSVVLVALTLSGCTQVNPLYNRGDTDGSSVDTAGAETSPGSAAGTDAGSAGSGVDTLTGGMTSASPTTSGVDTQSGSGGMTSGASMSGDDDGDTGEGDSTSTGGDATDSSGDTGTSTGGLVPLDFGQDCSVVDNCGDIHPDAECCDAAQCFATCMVPCSSEDECPFEGMGCHHGYCLFPCADNDGDCVDWPGFTCQHMGNFCENDF